MRKINVDSCLLKKAWQNQNMNMNTNMNMGKDMNMNMDMDMDIDTNMDRDNFNKYNTYKCIKNIIILQSKHKRSSVKMTLDTEYEDTIYKIKNYCEVDI